ncbi:uncharacterized protein DNG_07931 [Cephalotrichum gorgonifer]|uniref:Uncharacterized protein n=1 Tax=Cephalotrichum gorgonifer TaxID=2041049 RepID=A0AAE8N4C2_9PEZI|nr:uncharacterized protein DNG_07931 [Cephalotrichum gorgonifer]
MAPYTPKLVPFDAVLNNPVSQHDEDDRLRTGNDGTVTVTLGDWW